MLNLTDAEWQALGSIARGTQVADLKAVRRLQAMGLADVRLVAGEYTRTLTPQGRVAVEAGHDAQERVERMADYVAGRMGGHLMIVAKSILDGATHRADFARIHDARVDRVGEALEARIRITMGDGRRFLSRDFQGVAFAPEA